MAIFTENWSKSDIRADWLFFPPVKLDLKKHCKQFVYVVYLFSAPPLIYSQSFLNFLQTTFEAISLQNADFESSVGLFSQTGSCCAIPHNASGRPCSISADMRLFGEKDSDSFPSSTHLPPPDLLPSIACFVFFLMTLLAWDVTQLHHVDRGLLMSGTGSSSTRTMRIRVCPCCWKLHFKC